MIISPANRIRLIARQSLVALLGLVLVFTQSAVVFAQSQVVPSALDIDPPVIDHESLETGVAGQLQLFSALVVDDRGIDYVDFYYRSKTNSDFEKIPMEPVVGTANYVASIETELGQPKIEYYIEAADTGGNRVLKGFPFFPLVRNLEVEQLATVAPSAGSSTSSGNDSRWLYVALGALAVGLLVSASSSGGDGGSTPVDPDDQIPLTINISSPLD